jgi:GNAT superfamily N-acetyltransferase
VSGAAEVVVREAGAADAGAIAHLRAAWTADDVEDPTFPARMADWLAAEGERRTTWLAWLHGAPVGLASLFEYRRMPKPGLPPSAWGYVGNMFVRESLRDRGVGTRLLETLVATADARGYARLVLSPSLRSLPFYVRAGFVPAAEAAGDDRLLVRPGPAA